MKEEIKIFEEEIRKNVGIDFSVLEEKIIADSEIRKNEKDGVFSIRFLGRDYICKIKNYTKELDGYIYLIKELANRKGQNALCNSKEDFFRLAMNGEIDDCQIESVVNKYKIYKKPMSIFIVSVDNGSVKDIIEAVKGFSDTKQDVIITLKDNECVIVKFEDETIKDYQSFAQYAEFLANFIYETGGVRVGIYVGGRVESILELAISYNQALGAQSISREMGEKNGVYYYRDFIFAKMLKELPNDKLNEYLQLLKEENVEEIFSDRDMKDTANVFFSENLNISETSRKLNLHRNTLIYRLDKIERVTGLDIRKFNDAVTFRMITLLSKLVR